MKEDLRTEAQKARSKEIHHRVMIGMGGITVAAGLFAAYIAFSGAGDLPSWMYGRLRARAAMASPVRRGGKPLVAWRPWSAGLLREAQKHDRLILLDLTAFWPRSSRVMDETTYADPAVAAWLEKHAIAVRVDADARPDLELRYMGGGWPTTALLLPTGEVLDAATSMAAARFLAGGGALEAAFRKRRAGVMDAAADAADRRLAGRQKPMRRKQGALEAAEAARRSLEKAWDGQGFGPPYFPHFARIGFLRRLGQPWADGLAGKAVQAALKLEDPVWGGFFRYAGKGWSDVAYEKRLVDQAESLLAGLPPEAQRRTLAFVHAFLADPAGGYGASQASELQQEGGLVLEGWRYFSYTDFERRKRGLPAVDRRLFAAPNALMARAVLEAGGQASPTQRAHALKTLERWWASGIQDGQVSRELGQTGLRGFLADQTAMGEAFLTAYLATHEKRQLDRAWSVGCGLLRLSVQGGALNDRPRRSELPEGLDQLQAPALNAAAARFFRRLVRSRDDRGRPCAPDPEGLGSWLEEHSDRLDPVEWAAFLLP